MRGLKGTKTLEVQPPPTIPNEQIKHDPKKSRFQLKIAPRSYAYILYDISQEDPPVWRLWHTQVPKKYRRMGIAKRLAMGAFKILDELGVQCVLDCDYLQSLHAIFPSYKAIDNNVTVGSDP